MLRFLGKLGILNALSGTPLMKWVGQKFLENTDSAEELTAKLEHTHTSIRARFLEAGESEFSKKLLAHIITIERWGISRLQMLLGEKPFVLDASRLYAPPDSSTWQELLADFSQTRQELLLLVPKLAQTSNTVEHNAFGQLSGRGWLRYLATHASRESKKL